MSVQFQIFKCQLRLRLLSLLFEEFQLHKLVLFMFQLLILVYNLQSHLSQIVLKLLILLLHLLQAELIVFQQLQFNLGLPSLAVKTLVLLYLLLQIL